MNVAPPSGRIKNTVLKKKSLQELNRDKLDLNGCTVANSLV